MKKSLTSFAALLVLLVACSEANTEKSEAGAGEAGGETPELIVRKLPAPLDGKAGTDQQTLALELIAPCPGYVLWRFRNLCG